MVDYWPTDIAQNPCCPHGPTLLFSRKHNQRKFYACSAFRDRKKCPYFRWHDTLTRTSQDIDCSFVGLDHSFSKCDDDFMKLNERTSARKIYCFTCDLQIIHSDVDQHNYHILSENTDGLSPYPTLIMKSKDSAKGESQYHFCDSTLNTFVEFFKQLQISSVLCIGCPRLHEFLMKDHESFSSMLLDIDERYKHFYDPSQFQSFNMFNYHFFDSGAEKRVKSFMRSNSRLALIVDPPFGGRIEPLEYTLKRLIALQKKKDIESSDILIFLILPYFMETAVLKSFPNISMLDYKVEYKNHRRFRKRENLPNVKGSAVRIFTNYSSSRFILPAEEGYKYCIVCDRWICKENKHCYKCETCTSKNGGRYKHCDACNKCVKVSWKHCMKCGICKLADHSCSSEPTLAIEEVKNESRTIVKKRKNAAKSIRIQKKRKKNQK